MTKIIDAIARWNPAMWFGMGGISAILACAEHWVWGVGAAGIVFLGIASIFATLREA